MKVLSISIIILFLGSAVILAGWILISSRGGPGTDNKALPLGEIKLPPGFRIDLYTDSVPDAREMALGANSTLYVGTRNEGKVYALRDLNGDSKADKVYVIASGLNMPSGVAYKNGSLYVAEVSRILRYDSIDSRLDNPPKPIVVYDKYPDSEWHGWKYIAFGPDGYLYVPIGAPCNICNPNDPYATITRLKPYDSGNNTSFEIYARGIRNTVGFDWDEVGRLWFTDNGRDWLGDNAPPDELNVAPGPGLHFGYPYIHGKDITDPEFGEGHNASEFTPPAAELDAHVAALGMKFYKGDIFPEGYRGSIFIAEHGSWNREKPIGYRIEVATVRDGQVVNHTVFADGWLQGNTAWGRPVDVLVLPDGSMLVSDDQAGAIYRIAYQG